MTQELVPGDLEYDLDEEENIENAGAKTDGETPEQQLALYEYEYLYHTDAKKMAKSTKSSPGSQTLANHSEGEGDNERELLDASVTATKYPF